jgi:hypothetical protein
MKGASVSERNQVEVKPFSLKPGYNQPFNMKTKSVEAKKVPLEMEEVQPSTENLDSMLSEIQSLLSSKNIEFLKSAAGKVKIQQSLLELGLTSDDGMEKEEIPQHETPSFAGEDLPKLYNIDAKIVITDSSIVSAIRRGWQIKNPTVFMQHSGLLEKFAFVIVNSFREFVLEPATISESYSSFDLFRVSK